MKTKKISFNNIQSQKIPPNRIRKFQFSILQWYEKHGRHFPWRIPSKSKYQHIIAEILLQRTRAETIAIFYKDFIHDFPSWKKLSEAEQTQLRHYLHPIGLWRRRSSSIHLLAEEMVRRNGRFPHKREEIESLPGIGQYIANSVLLFCHGEPQPLLDVNMARVLERTFGPRKLADIRDDPYLQDLALKVVNCKTPRIINWAILDLAATVCTVRKPLCKICPILNICQKNCNNSEMD